MVDLGISLEFLDELMTDKLRLDWCERVAAKRPKGGPMPMTRAEIDTAMKDEDEDE